ncbi:GntR family transcriptional regulator [Azospirillum sp. sgz301742]
MRPTPDISPADLEQTDRRLPLYARLRDVLTRHIAEGAWPPGEALPAENALAGGYGVSVGTMRKALQQLVDEGLLERRHGSGTFVRRAQFDKSLFRFFRHAGDSGGDGGGDRGDIPVSRILRREVVPAAEAPEAALGLPPDAPVIRMQRLRLWGDEPFLAEDIVLPHDRFRAFLDIPVEELGPLLYPVYETQCGQVVARAEELLTVGEADAAVARLLRCRPGTPMVSIERTAFAHDGTALEWRRSRGRADGFSYRVEIR